MKKIAFVATAAAFALAACGETTDASDDAIADSVEVPADDSMAGMPDPVADDEAMTDGEVDAQMDAGEAVAEEAADNAQAAADEAREILDNAE